MTDTQPETARMWDVFCDARPTARSLGTHDVRLDPAFGEEVAAELRALLAARGLSHATLVDRLPTMTATWVRQALRRVVWLSEASTLCDALDADLPGVLTRALDYGLVRGPEVTA